MNRRFILLALGGAFVLLVIWLLLSTSGTATLTITTPAATPNNSDIQVRITRDGQEEENFKLNPGDSREVRLQKGIVRVDGTAGELKAVDVVEIGATKTLLTPDSEQRNIAKLGANAVFCPLTVQDRLYSYNCLGGGGVVRHASTTATTPLYNGQQFGQLEPLKDGLLGFYANDMKALQYINLNAETIERVPLPTVVQSLLDQEYPLFVTTNQPGGSHFALVFQAANKVYLFRDVNDASPSEITPPKSMNEAGRQILPGFSGTTFTLFFGTRTQDHDGEEVGAVEAEREEKILPAYLYEYNESGKLSQTIHVPAEFGLTDLKRITGNYYQGAAVSSFEFFYLNDDTLRHIYAINEVGNWATLDGKVYLQNAGAIFEFTPGQNGQFGLHSLYASTAVDASMVFATSRGVVFTGHTAPGVLDIYQLLDSQADPSTFSAPAKRIEPSFIGFEKFTDLGVSSDQLQSLREAFKAYINQVGQPAQEVVAIGIQIIPPARGSAGGVYTAQFTTTINNQELRSTMEFSGLNHMKLFLYSASGALVFEMAAENL